MRTCFKKIILPVLMLGSAVAGYSEEYAGKSILIPDELKSNDFRNPESKWSFDRMVSTDNIVLFWAPGFGGNINTAPNFETQNMKVDLANLLERLESFYHTFRDELEFVRPGSKSERYKMMVMLDYSLEGTAYGGDYDGQIGALWIAPNRVQDHKLNCIAHELGHSFQSQIICDGQGEAWGGCGFFEMASQWMLWQVNPDWPTDENYHLNAYRDATHKAFLHIDNIYRSPYVLEIWSEKYGKPYIAELFRQGRTDEDPAMTHMRLQGFDQNAFNKEMFEAQRRFINWDIDRVRDNMRPYANKWHTKMTDAGGGRYRVAPENAPESYGFNAIGLEVPEPGKTVTVDFTGEPSRKGYHTPDSSNAGWRYGFVAVDRDGNSTYSPMCDKAKGSISYTAPSDSPISHLWLVVMGAPKKHVRNVDGPDNPGDPQYPYSIRLKGTSLK